MTNLPENAENYFENISRNNSNSVSSMIANLGKISDCL